jgi:hypothetical protein
MFQYLITLTESSNQAQHLVFEGNYQQKQRLHLSSGEALKLLHGAQILLDCFEEGL